MRRVQIIGGRDGSPGYVDVADTANIQQMRKAVAQQCNVALKYVKLLVNGPVPPNQVPPAGQEVTAAVGSADHQAIERSTRTVSIPPRPNIMRQEMEGLNVVVAFDEVIDNSIRANATCITLQLQQDNSGTVTRLECNDDGDGMPYDLAVNHMRLAHTDSGVVTAPREYNKPLAAALYFSKELSRHGKGAAAILYFGNMVETVTKTQDATETVTVSMDYNTWLEEVKQKGSCTYQVVVKDWFDFASDDGGHYTNIHIQDLKQDVAAELANPQKRREWAQQISDHYMFFLRGFPEELWVTLPDILQQGTAADTRPAGALTLEIFGLKLGAQLPQAGLRPQPRLNVLLDTFLQLSRDVGQQPDGRPKLMPFWLPIRWVEHGMQVEQVPAHAAGQDDSSGPAGKLKGVHRDFLLLLMYYPYKDGERTKPKLIGEEKVEQVMFTAWCGRLIPKAFSHELPPLVEAASKSTNVAAEAWMLKPSRLCAILFCSPEVYTSNHKTELLDQAFDAVRNQLGAPSSSAANAGAHEHLWCWDVRRGKWCTSAGAAGLLVRHHKEHWQALEEQGQLLQETLHHGEVIGKEFKPPGSSFSIKAGELVRLWTAEEQQAAAEPDTGAEAGSSKQRRVSATPQSNKGGGGSGGREILMPGSYRVVEYFKQKSNLEDGPRYKVQLREWVPNWLAESQPGGRLAGLSMDYNAALISAVTPRQAKELEASWLNKAPSQLAWWDPGRTHKNRQAYADIAELPGIPSASLLTKSQVPSSLVLCYLSRDKQVVEFKKNYKWSSSIHLGSKALDVNWKLQHTVLSSNSRTKTIANGSTTYSEKNKAVIEGFRDLVNDMGSYCLQVTSACPWVTTVLAYNFKVVGDQVHTLEATWGSSSSAGRWSQPTPLPVVRLAEELPVLELRAKDASGKAVPFPIGDKQAALRAIQVLVKVGDTGKLLTTAPDVTVAADGKLIKLHSWTLKAQKLPSGTSTPTQAFVSVEVHLPDSEPLQLPQQAAPVLRVMSGPPSRLEALTVEASEHPAEQPYKAAGASRGSRVFDMKLVILDTMDNKLDTAPGEAYCARIKFEPPGAAELHRSRGDAGPSSAAKRRKSAAAAGGSAVPAWHPISVDGNVVELTDEFRWCAPPGAGPVGVTIQVFQSDTLPQAADAQPLLTHTGFYAMQRMHCAVEHPLLPLQQDEASEHERRWLVWKGTKSFNWSEGVAFQLNTRDFTSAIEVGRVADQRAIPREVDANVPDEVLNRCCSAYEPRRDVQAGQLVTSYITPSGTVLSSQVPAAQKLVKGKVPFFVAEHWNGLLEQPLVYEVAFVVPASEGQQLDGIQLQLCNEADAYDEDFKGRAKLCLLGSEHSVYSSSSSTTLNIAGGMLSLPAITLRPEWFTAASKGRATLVLLDDEPGPVADPAAAGSSSGQQSGWQGWGQEHQPQKELGRIHLRLAPAAEKLRVMAAGALFEQAVVTLERKQGGAGRGKRKQQEGDLHLRLVKQQQQPAGSAGAARSSAQAAAAVQGAWAPWKCAEAGGNPDDSKHINPRHILSHTPLQLQLGQPVTLHFVATDYLGCPAVLSHQHRRELLETGLQMEPVDDGPAIAVDALSCDWKFSKGASGGAAAASGGHLGGPLVNSCTLTVTRGCGKATLHLKLTGSFGQVSELRVPVQLQQGAVAVDGVQLQQARVQPFGAAMGAGSQYSCHLVGYIDPQTWQLLQVPAEAEVRIKREPGLEPDPQQQLQLQQQQQQLTVPSGAGMGLMCTTAGRRTRRPRRQAEQLLGGDEGNPIDFTMSSEEEGEEGSDAVECMDTDGPAQQQQPQPQLSAKQQWLASLGPQGAGLLYELQEQGVASPVVEGSSVKLRLQLFDSAAQEIAAAKQGTLRVMHLANWQAVSQQPELPQEWTTLQQQASFKQGAADVVLQLGVGDEWVGEQLYKLQPEGQQGSELAAALPVLLKVQVAPGPFVDQLLLLPDVADPAAAAAGGGGSGAGSSSVGQVTAAEAAALLSSDSSSSDTPQEELLQALLEAAAEPADQLAGRLITALQVRPDGQVPAAVLPEVTFSVSTRNGSIPLQQQLQQLRVQLQQWTPAATAAGGGAWVPVQEAGSWSAVQAVLQDIDHHQQQQQDEAGQQQQQQQQQQQVTYPVPAELRQLPSKAGLYRLLASYVRDLPGGQDELRMCCGPYLLLPGAPHKLSLLPDPGHPPGGNTSRQAAKTGRGRGAGRGGARGGGRNSAAAEAAVPTNSLVLLDDLGTTSSTQRTLQLQDCCGNVWSPAAAQLSARLPATGLDPTPDASDLPQGPQQGVARQQQGGGGASDDDWASEGIEVHLVLLAAALQADQGQQQQQDPEPRSKRQRTAAAGSSAAAPGSAAAGDTGGAAGGDGWQQQWLLHILLLRALDAPNAAGSSNPAAAAAAAAGGRCIHSLPFTADGSCVVPAMLLSELGIDNIGEWQLWAQAACGSSSSSSSSSGVGSSTGSAAELRVQLGGWHIVLQDTHALVGERVRLTSRLKALQDTVRRVDTVVGETQASRQGLAQKLREEEAAARDAHKDVLARQQNLNASGALVQLREAAGNAARQQQLLGEVGRRPMMLEWPWMFSRGAAGAANRPCTVDEVRQEQLLPSPLMQLHLQHPSILGPLVTLGAVESPDVARVLSALLSGDLHQLICLDTSAQPQIVSALPQRDFSSLQLPELLRYFTIRQQRVPANQQTWYHQHPQQLLPPTLRMRELLAGVLEWQEYSPEAGFVGFGANLVHLNPQLLALAVQLLAKPVIDNMTRELLKLDYHANAQLTADLRSTLWQWKLGNVLVFESEQHVQRFRDTAARQNKTLNAVRLVALDGFTYNLKVGSVRHRLRLDDVRLHFGPAGPAAAEDPLDLRLRCIKERHAHLADARRVKAEHEQVAAQTRQQLAQLDRDLAAAKQQKDEAEAEREQEKPALLAELARLEDEMEQRQRVQT